MKNIFVDILKKYSDDHFLISKLWHEIEDSYSQSGRYYHNLLHLENIIEQLYCIKSDICDWDTILLSTFYHDIVYDVKSDRNEEDSADVAKKRLDQVLYPSDPKAKCIAQILATKNHEITGDIDTEIFIDSDLSILGLERDVYLEYARNVRKEYAIYSDEVYNRGRIAVLTSMLQKETLFKTKYFFDKFEKQARENIVVEVHLLS